MWVQSNQKDSAKEDNHSLPTREVVASVTSESGTQLTIIHNNINIDVNDDISCHDGAVVISSKLLAKRLGIQHKSFEANSKSW